VHLNLPFQVIPQFVVEILLDVAAAEEGAKTQAEHAKEAHGVPPFRRDGRLR
jgi:hypothetical protein